jgi:hypothetical protein
MIAREQAAGAVASSPIDPLSGCGWFGRFPTWAAALPGISGLDLRVLAAIAHHADDEGRAFPGMKRIALLARINRSKVPPSVAKLIAAGVLLKEMRADERGHQSNLYTIVYKQIVFPGKGTPVTRGGNRVFPPAEAGGVPRGGNRTDQFKTDQGTGDSPLRARGGGNGFCLDGYQPDQTMADWAAEHVPELDDPLNANTVARFKDHYRKTWTKIVDPDAAYRKWLLDEPYYRRRRAAREHGNQRNKPSSMLDAALDELRKAEGIDG